MHYQRTAYHRSKFFSYRLQKIHRSEFGFKEALALIA
jgi:hypothetical protein